MLYQGYPQEWFPSVSATIGDRYPERSVFQLFIAMTSGRPIIIVYLSTPSSPLPSRSPLCPGLPLVPPYCKTQFGAPQSGIRNRNIPYAHLRRMDICDIYG